MTSVVLKRVIVVATVLVAAAAVSLPASAVRPNAAGTACSKATARKLIDAHQLNGFLLPPAQVLCGPFTGAGSRAMVVTTAAATCWAVQSWSVFSFTGNAWNLVFTRPGFIFPPVVAVGSDLRVETPIFLRSDKTRCNPSGGSEARLWHWNGKTFIPGPPKRVKPATPSKR
jgi:hypothetical protein